MGWFVTIFAMAALLAPGAQGAAQKRELSDSKTSYILHLPRDSGAGKGCELVIALHGAGDTAENFQHKWVPHMNGRPTALAVPQGSVPVGPGFTWSTDDLKQILGIVEDAVKNFGVDRKRIMLTGFSAGCAMGFHFVSKQPQMFACYGGMGHGVQQNLVNEKELEAAAATTAVYYAVGKQDFNYPHYPTNVELLKRLKFNLVNEDPDIGHKLVEEECKHALAHFDSTADKANQAKLAEAKRLLAGKNWGAAETALTALSAGRGLSAAEAKTLLATIQKEQQQKFETAKAQSGPEAVVALEKFAREYAGTALAGEAKTLSDQIAKDPKTASIAQQRSKNALEARAEAAWKDAEALEKSGKIVLAADAYERVAKEFADSTLKDKAAAAATRLRSDPKLNAAKNSAEAERMLKRAENFMRNGAADEAKDLFKQIAEKFPDTDAARKAKKQLE